MNKSYVYILTDNRNKRIKIGLSNNYQDRVANLKRLYKSISLKDSYLIECQNNFAKKLEKILHSLFCDYSIQLNENLDGSTEWFDISIKDSVLNAINDMKKYNSDILKIKKGIKLPKNKNNKIDKENKKQKEIEKYRKENLKNTIKFLKILKGYIQKYKFKIKYDNNFCIITFYLNGDSIKIKDELPLFGFDWYLGGSTFVYEVYKHSQEYLEIYLKLNMLCLKYKEIKELKDPLILLNKFFKKYFNIDIFSYRDKVYDCLFCDEHECDENFDISDYEVENMDEFMDRIKLTIL